MTAPAPQQMTLRNVPTGHLFSFDMASIYKLTAKAGMGPQTTLHASSYTPQGLGDPVPAEVMAQYLDTTVHTMPDPAGPSAGITLPSASLPLPAPVTTNLATAAQEAAAVSALQSTLGAVPVAAPVTPGSDPEQRPAFLKHRSTPLQQAVDLFSGWITWPEEERTLGQRFQLAAFSLAEGPDSLATVRALLALHDASRLARGYAPVLSPF